MGKPPWLERVKHPLRKKDEEVPLGQDNHDTTSPRPHRHAQRRLSSRRAMGDGSVGTAEAFYISLLSMMPASPSDG